MPIIDAGEKKKYFFEIWLRGYAKDYLRNLNIDASDKKYHPHITFSQPFNPKDSETNVRIRVIEYCNHFNPLPFKLKGINSFDEGVVFADVIDSDILLNFNNGLENVISDLVVFGTKMADEKKLHATIKKPIADLNPNFEVEQYMLRLTGIRNKKIWFSYDFVLHQELSRKESLDKGLWYKSVHLFTQQTGLLPTRQGYKSIS